MSLLTSKILTFASITYKILKLCLRQSTVEFYVIIHANVRLSDLSRTYIFCSQPTCRILLNTRYFTYFQQLWLQFLFSKIVTTLFRAQMQYEAYIQKQTNPHKDDIPIEKIFIYRLLQNEKNLMERIICLRIS